MKKISKRNLILISHQNNLSIKIVMITQHHNPQTEKEFLMIKSMLTLQWYRTVTVMMDTFNWYIDKQAEVPWTIIQATWEWEFKWKILWLPSWHENYIEPSKLIENEFPF